MRRNLDVKKNLTLEEVELLIPEFAERIIPRMEKGFTPRLIQGDLVLRHVSLNPVQVPSHASEIHSYQQLITLRRRGERPGIHKFCYIRGEQYTPHILDRERALNDLSNSAWVEDQHLDYYYSKSANIHADYRE